MATVSVTFAPAAGRAFVELTSWAGDATFATTPVAGNQIEGPDTLTLNADGTVTGPDGYYVLRQMVAVSGQVEVIESYTVGTPDAVAPVLTSPAITIVSNTAADASITTDEAGGTVWALLSGNATESVVDIAANGASQTVSAAGVQTFSFTGMAPETPYYVHFVHEDAWGNASGTATTGSFATLTTATVTATYGAGSSNTAVTLGATIDPYLFQGWIRQPVQGEQLVTQTSAGAFNSKGEFTTDVEAVIPVKFIALDGTVHALSIDTTGLETAVDSNPNAFTFTPQLDVARNVPLTSNAITVTGVDAGVDVPVTVTGGEYSVSTNSGATWGGWTSAETTVRLNYQVRARHTSSSTYGTSVSTTITIGGRAGTFTTTTLADAVAPVISLTGGNQTIAQGATWSEPGYSSTDNADGDISVGVVVTGSVDTSTLGQYVLTYTSTDSSGNTSTATRTVTVVEAVPDDAVKPTISLVGGNQTLNVGDAWVEPGYTANDNVDGDLTDQVVVVGTVDTSSAGATTLTYTVTDAAGNVGTVTRTVTVVATVDLDIAAPYYRTVIPAENELGAMASTTFYKAPKEDLDYDIALEEWLTGEADVITSGIADLNVEVDGAGLNVLATGYDETAKHIKVWLGGGTEGMVYTVSAFITTGAGRRKKFIFRLVTRTFW